jgi:8-amino-7-oxononanoate synthase
METSVAIIGVGARFPGSPDAVAFRRMVRTGAVHVRPVPAERWDHRVVHSSDRRQPNKTPAQAGAFIDDFDRFAPEFFGVTPKRAKIMDPQQRLMLEITRQALEDAGYARRRLGDGRTGVYVGACSSDHRLLVAGAVNIPCDLAGRSGRAPPLTPEQALAVPGALPPIQGYSIVGQQLNMIAANVSQVFDFHGPAFAIDTACSSALAALHEAVLHLRGGAVDAAIVGGVYLQIDPIMMVCFSRVGALSFSDACRPFGADADGFVLGEGVGAVVLKRHADALRDGDRVLAVIRGIAMNNDGRGAGPLTPAVSGQTAAIRQAWRDAQIELGTVGLIEAHATGTQVGDGVELAALQQVFAGNVAGPVPISSVKANIGHGLAAAGMASLLKATLAVHDGFVPPQPKSGTLRAELTTPEALLRVPERVEPWTPTAGVPRRAGVSAFGFGGTNVHVVLEAPALPTRPASAGRKRRFTFSAPTAELLATHVANVAAAMRDQPVALADVAVTLAQRRADRVQVAMAAENEAEFHEQTAALREALARGELPTTDTAVVEDGTLALLPPSPLLERRFWLIDEEKTQRVVRPPAGSTPLERPAQASQNLERTVAAIAAVTAWRPDEVKPEQRLVGDLGFDSLTTLEFMTVLGRSLPGMPAPPRTMFTPALTVAELAAFLDRHTTQAAAADLVPAPVFELARHPWLHAHRPRRRAVLPLAALLHAAQSALHTRLGGSVAVENFKVLAPVEVAGDRLALSVEVGAGNEFTVRAAEGGAALAVGTIATTVDALLPLIEPPRTPGALPLETFYAEFGFHGPSLQALHSKPSLGPTSASGWLRPSADPVVTLDGALQLALYWLAETRKQTAVAMGFARLVTLAPWPVGGVVRCTAQLADDAGEALRGHFDFRDERGALLAQWRGVEARLLSARVAAECGAAAWPEVRALAARKQALAAAGLVMPYFRALDGVAASSARIGGRELVNFSTYNYLGLAGHAAVKQAAAAAVERYGTSASASRVASGERPVHGELERALADFLGCEDALALVSGHATNVSAIGHLFGPEDLIVHDQLAHDCIVTGARLSGARRLAFPHNDVEALAELLAEERPKARRVLIAVEGVYSMDGDLAPLRRIVELKREHDALLLVDEAHSLGVLGATGRGAGEHFEVARRDVDLWMGTLSKALASCGGYLAGRSELIDYLRFTLPGFVYSVGLSPANAAAGLAALQVLEREPARVRQLRTQSDLFRDLARERGLDIGASEHSAVVPCITGSSERALRLAEALRARDINVQPIFHPAVEEGRARLRFFVTAEHTEAEVRATVHTLAEEFRALAEVREEARA